MKFSAKRPAPKAFVDWLEQENNDWKPTYSQLSGPPMQAVQQSLLEEQGYVCCYCGRRLPLDGSEGHIDHFWPQSRFNGTTADDRRLDYNNFFRSCGPRGQRGVPTGRPSTCGEAKGDWYDIHNSILPSDPGCERRFVYGQTGAVKPSNPDDKAALNMIKQLNLNDRALDYERSVIIEEIEAALAKGISASSEHARTRTPINGQLPGFGHVAARYLEEEFKL
ncbi:retron system putative HNH endonuclease [Pleomorphomonas sp. JP5]|uniref:retron system putative HNH endonuclease n=1 Tax=Pleomorphomonas sp. JP5 TaxID=2942998 RepID=UPI002043E4F1|nr:retron system putative HNH endonuclease [Pleomorphomonas sp. JP5]MCM5557248.1 TIGR02646 family protein [Pleomorphomonas sp. JP5]